MHHTIAFWVVFATLIAPSVSEAQHGLSPARRDSAQGQGETRTSATEEGEYPNSWGVDILISANGFGLGGFYRREFTPDVFGFVSLSVSEAKDSREVEQYDPYYQVSTVPGKLNRFMVFPLMFGVQYRLFREDIVETFRPYVNAAMGPTMIYMTPFADIVQNSDGSFSATPVEFFHSFSRGTPHYTASAYIGFGANFGSERGSIFGVNFRYYFTYLLGNGLPSLYDIGTGQLAGTKKDFGGFFITLNLGMGY